MKLKHFLGMSLFIFGASAHAETIDQDGALRHNDGRLLTMRQAEAIEACTRHGMHLPTVRELVVLNRSSGLSLKETREVTEEEKRIGVMKPISAINPNGMVDSFYYNNDNYSQPRRDLGKNCFWSSSIAPSNYASAGYGLDATRGNILGYASYGALFAVRCVVGR